MSTPAPSLLKFAVWHPDFTGRALLGGAALGGGVGLISALLRQRQAILEEEDDEEDVLPILRKQAADVVESALGTMATVGEAANSVANWFTPKSTATAASPSTDVPQGHGLGLMDYATAGTAFPLGALGALYGTRRLYQGWHRQDRQQKLKDEQEALMQAIEDEARTKQAAAAPADGRRPVTTPALAMMAVLGSAGLGGIAAGMLTDRILEQQFPMNKKPKGSGFRIGGIKPEAEEEDPNDATSKVAASEHLIHTALELTGYLGSDDLPNLVKAAASGLLPDVSERLAHQGVDEALDLASTVASTDLSNPLVKFAAVRALMRSPAASLAEITAASTLANVSPETRQRGAEIRAFPKLAAKFEELGKMLVPLALLGAMDEDQRKRAATVQSNPQQAAELGKLVGTDHASGSLQTQSSATEHSSEGRAVLADKVNDTAQGKDEVDSLMAA